MTTQAAGPGASMPTGSVPAVDAASAARLGGLVPALRRRVVALMDAMHAAGHPVRMTAGYRTTQEQQALWAKGRTVPGLVVTWCDGLVRRSRHQDGRAADFVFRTETGISWHGPWERLGETAESLGLIWG